MSQTLINGTAYTIDHGNTMVNSTQYVIDHGNTLIAGVQYRIDFAKPYSIEDWPGWSNATWEDINNLCYAKKRGYINSWPNDVAVGNTKSVTLNYSASSQDTLTAYLIGIDHDADDTLTFATLYTNTILASTSNTAPYTFQTSNIRTKYKSTSVRVTADPDYSYILPVNKGYASEYYSNTLTYEELIYWPLSLDELNRQVMSISPRVIPPNVAEYTENVTTPYPYFQSTTDKAIFDSLVAYQYAVALRSVNADQQKYTIGFAGTLGLGESTHGQTAIAPYSSADYFCPTLGFVIGNPAAQTIE